MHAVAPCFWDVKGIESAKHRQLLAQPHVGTAVFLLSFAVLSYEVAITRVFAAVLKHHFAFLAVSIAICGLGLGGLALHVWRDKGATNECHGRLARWACGFALTSALVLAALLTIVFPYAIESTWIAGALLLLPFGCAGVFLAEVFARYPERGGSLYAADLVGAAVAAIVVIAVLQWTGAINASLFASVVGALAGLWCGGTKAVRNVARGVALASGLALSSNLAFDILDIAPIVSDGASNDEGPAAQPLFSALAKPGNERPKIVYTDWNAVVRTDVVADPSLGDDEQTVLKVYHNGNVPTRMVRIDGDLRKDDPRALIGPLLDNGVLPAIAYVPFTVRSHERVLALGPGGGMDVLFALLAGVEHIEGAELNPTIEPLMKRYADFTGHVYERDNVAIATAEGRSYLQSSPHTYDMIYGALTQSHAGTQGLALMESYLYTVEAFGDYWDHLSQDGQLAFVVHNPLYVLRWLGTAGDMLRARGMTDPEIARRILIVGSPAAGYSYLFVVKKSPFSPAESRAVRSFARRYRLEPLHTPGFGGDLDAVMDGSKSLDEFIAAAIGTADEPIDVSTTTDDKPFFVDLVPGVPAGLVGLCIGAVVLVVAFSGFGLWEHRRDRQRLRHIAPFIFYFALLGAGFMLIEIPLIQKLTLPLGYPTLALTMTLFALLLGGGFGSALTQRVTVGKRLRTLVSVAAVLAAVVAVTITIVLAQTGGLLALSFGARAAVLVVAVLVLGACLGVPFPAGIRMLAGARAAEVPWMWGINGVMSVVGSLAAALGATMWGFGAMLACGAALYLAAAAVVWALVVRDGDDG